MKTIELTQNDFDILYDILSDYLHTKISADECIANGLKYIEKKKLLSKPFEDCPIGEGYMLIRRYPPHYNGFRSIYFSPYEKKLFYEGIVSFRYLDEMRYVDYMFFDREDIEMICKKYNLKPIETT
jgi:hypothetical protein